MKKKTDFEKIFEKDIKTGEKAQSIGIAALIIGGIALLLSLSRVLNWIL